MTLLLNNLLLQAIEEVQPGAVFDALRRGANPLTRVSAERETTSALAAVVRHPQWVQAMAGSQELGQRARLVTWRLFQHFPMGHSEMQEVADTYLYLHAELARVQTIHTTLMGRAADRQLVLASDASDWLHGQRNNVSTIIEQLHKSVMWSAVHGAMSKNDALAVHDARQHFEAAGHLRGVRQAAQWDVVVDDLGWAQLERREGTPSTLLDYPHPPSLEFPVCKDQHTALSARAPKIPSSC